MRAGIGFVTVIMTVVLAWSGLVALASLVVLLGVVLFVIVGAIS